MVSHNIHVLFKKSLYVILLASREINKTALVGEKVMPNNLANKAIDKPYIKVLAEIDNNAGAIPENRTKTIDGRKIATENKIKKVINRAKTPAFSVILSVKRKSLILFGIPDSLTTV